jgi:hypothetical protein
LDKIYTRAHQFAHPEQWGPNQGVENFMFIADIATIFLTPGVDKIGRVCIIQKWFPKNFAPGKLDSHFLKHLKEWGGITKDAYLKRARALLSKDVSNDIMGFISKEGWVFRYNKRTNELAIGKPDGTIETLFRPSRGIDYYFEQVTRYGK